MPRKKTKEEEMEEYARKRSKQMRKFKNEPISDPYMDALTKGRKRTDRLFAKARYL